VREELELRLGRALPDAPEPAAAIEPMRDHVGVTPQREPGLYALGGATLRGRFTGEQMITVAWIAERYGTGRVRFTNRQNVLVLDVPEALVAEASKELAAAGVEVEASSFRRQVISCTGIEFCRLAVSETKEVAAGIIAHLEERIGDLDPPVRINVNGCPNACAQYQIADIGLQGALAKRGDEKVLGFQLHLGGRLGEERTFGKRTAKPVPAEDVRFVLERVLLAYRDEREPGESFGRWVDRQEEARLVSLVGTNLDEGGIPGSTAYSDPQTLPQVLVSPAWLEEHLDDPTVAIVEVSEDRTLYPSAHIVGARAIDPADLHGDDGRAPVLERLAGLLSELGITPEHTIVLYGDRDNWFASYAFWLLRRLGHRDLRLLDGGRRRWLGEQRPANGDERAHGEAHYPVPELALPGIRAQRGEVEAVLDEPGTLLLDVRTREEYDGTTTHDPAFPQEAAERAGHIPGAVHVPWEAAVREDGSIRPLVELRGVFEKAGVKPEQDVIVYCRIGERASHTWLVLQELLGYPRVRVYDGSWTEWAQHHDLPIAQTSAAGGEA
jgi:thiosulfate/3-mercaptopyruvate sulfurtransferase